MNEHGRVSKAARFLTVYHSESLGSISNARIKASYLVDWGERRMIKWQTNKFTVCVHAYLKHDFRLKFDVRKCLLGTLMRSHFVTDLDRSKSEEVPVDHMNCVCS